MLSEQDLYEQLKQIQGIELHQRNLFAELLMRVEDKKLRIIIQRFVDMENEHEQILENLASLYAESI